MDQFWLTSNVISATQRNIRIQLDILKHLFIDSLGKYITSIRKHIYMTSIRKHIYMTSIRNHLYMTSLRKHIYLTSIRKQIYMTSIRNTNKWCQKGNKLYMTSKNIPNSQSVPCQPPAHEHVYPLTPSTHWAPFWHGLLAHSSISMKQNKVTC